MVDLAVHAAAACATAVCLLRLRALQLLCLSQPRCSAAAVLAHPRLSLTDELFEPPVMQEMPRHDGY